MNPYEKFTLSSRHHNIEVFYVSAAEARKYTQDAKEADTRFANKGERVYTGWYYWFCFANCIPESDLALGPYPSRSAALNDALDSIDFMD